jgi:D-alanyl-D-alanine carboxypeptidase
VAIASVIYLRRTNPKSTQPATANPPDSKKATTTPNTLLVNSTHPLPNDYHPDDLVNLYTQEDRHFSLMSADIQVSKPVFTAMNKMFSAATQDGVKGFVITSGYRTRKEQKQLYRTTANGTAAKPGESEHETGLAFDVGAKEYTDFDQSPQFEWISKHCADYGFILRYPKDREDVTGYPFEPWHYRYVGKKAAKAITGKGITLEQYHEEQNNQKEVSTSILVCHPATGEGRVKPDQRSSKSSTTTESYCHYSCQRGNG